MSLFNKKDQPNIVTKKTKKMKIMKTKGPSSFLSILISFIMSVVIFLGLIVVQNKFSNNISYKKVVSCIQAVPAGTLITEDNISQYFTTKNVNILDVSENAITDVNELLEKQSIISFAANEVVSRTGFENTTKEVSEFKNPVELSISVSDLGNITGGKIRGGDSINITMSVNTDDPTQSSSNESLFDMNIVSMNDKDEKDTSDEKTQNIDENDSDAKDKENTTDNKKSEETTEATETTENSNNVSNVLNSANKSTITTYILKNVYVVEVLDSSGNKISTSDTEKTATILIFRMEQSDEEILNQALAKGSDIRISKNIK